MSCIREIVVGRIVVIVSLLYLGSVVCCGVMVMGICLDIVGVRFFIFGRYFVNFMVVGDLGLFLLVWFWDLIIRLVKLEMRFFLINL